jgi:hypothetical protein
LCGLHVVMELNERRQKWPWYGGEVWWGFSSLRQDWQS